MNGNRKLLLYGSAVAVLLLAAIIYFISKLFSPVDEGGGMVDKDHSLMRALPSDAVLIVDLKEISLLPDMLADTTSALYKMFDGEDNLVRFQNRAGEIEEFSKSEVLYSVHYSSKNEISLLSVISSDESLSESSESVQLKSLLDKRVKRYSDMDIYLYNNALYVACYENLVLMSSSLYVLESSVRHLVSGTSILDSPEMSPCLEKGGKFSSIYLNHHQVGKLFSGVMERGFLKYSDFFMRLTSCSSYQLILEDGRLLLKGRMHNGNDEKYQSLVLAGQERQKSLMGEILSHGTLYAFSLSFSDIGRYIEDQELYLEVRKRMTSYKNRQHYVDTFRVAKENGGVEDGLIVKAKSKEQRKKSLQIWREESIPPYTYLKDSLKLKEVVAAYCKFGDKCEWITFLREEENGDFSKMVSQVIRGKDSVIVEPYRFKGYVESLFGEAFSHCNEETFCKIGNWTVIGPKEVVKEFASGNANYTSLEYYLEQTPSREFLGSEGVVKIFANLKEGKETVLPVVKPYYGKMFEKALDYNNFECLTINMGYDGDEVEAEVDLYATRLQQLPQERLRESGESVIFVDSTIVAGKGPFELVNFVKGGKWYMEQLPNNKLRLMDGNRKGIWTIPFETPIGGNIEQIDFFNNGKLQMLFVSGNKVYLLDRVGRFVRGFPSVMPKRAVLGPKVIGPKRGECSFFVLNEDNTLSLYNLERNSVKEGLTLKMNHYVKELPEIVEIYGEKYIAVRSVATRSLFKMDGEQVTLKDKKRMIAPESEFVEAGDNQVEVTGTDGKTFIWNLETGKCRKK